MTLADTQRPETHAAGWVRICSIDDLEVERGRAALLDGEHISVDVLTSRLGARGRRRTLLAGFVAAAITAALLVFEGADMVAFSRMVDLKSNGYLAVPMWIPQAVVPLGAALMGAAAIVAFAAAWRDRSDGPVRGHAQPLSARGVD